MTLICKFRVAVITTSVLLVQGLPLHAAKEAPKAVPDKKPASSGKPSKTSKKPADAAGQIEAQLRRSFKSWDRDKNKTVAKEEMEKFYSRLKAKPKKAQPDAANQLDAMASIAALHARLDTDQDQEISQVEFDAWAADFAAYLGKYFDLLDQRTRAERDLVGLQALLARSPNVTATEGAINDDLNRGVIRNEQTIKGLDKQMEQLDAESGHTDYREFVVLHVLKVPRR